MLEAGSAAESPPKADEGCPGYPRWELLDCPEDGVYESYYDNDSKSSSIFLALGGLPSVWLGLVAAIEASSLFSAAGPVILWSLIC
jgi:hypothetical protein